MILRLRVPQARTTQRPKTSFKTASQKNSFLDGSKVAGSSGGEFGSMLRFALRHPWLTLDALFGSHEVSF